MDASYCRSLVRLEEQHNENPSESKKVDQLYPPISSSHWLLFLCIVIFFSLVSVAQSPRARTFEPGLNNSAVSVAELNVPDKAWSHLRAAHKAFGQGNLKEATREADRALDVYPKCAPAFSIKAFIDLAAKDPRAAVEHATQATSIDPYNADSFVALAMAYNSTNDFPGGQHAARKALNIRPNSWQARLELAKSFYGQDQFEAALAELNAIRTDFPDVHLVKGNVLMRLGRAQEGAVEFALFLTESPLDSRAGAIQGIISRTQVAPAF